MKLTITHFHPLLFFLILVVACSTRAQEIDDENNFSYDEGSEKGPAHWGEIRPEWKNCSSGEMQSPIDLVDQKVQIVSRLGTLFTTYRPSNATLKNRGHDMMLRWPGGAGHVQINGTLYQLNQLHWHSPSEHTINGRRYDMEAHLVHQTNDARVAVIAIFYKIRAVDDPFLTRIKDDLEALAHTRDVEKVVGEIDPHLTKFGSRKYYRYMGSLTTPPCSPNVTWTILRKVKTVSKEQVQLIRDAIHDDSKANARPLQQLNDRIVELYKPNRRGE